MSSTRTFKELEALRLRLEQSGIGRSNPRAHSAVRDFDEGIDFEEAAARAVRHEAAARETWIASALDPWAKRHGLTRAQALSVAFDDSPFNPANPQRDQVTLKDLYAWSGQEHGFAAYLMGEGREEAVDEIENDAGTRPAG